MFTSLFRERRLFRYLFVLEFFPIFTSLFYPFPDSFGTEFPMFTRPELHFGLETGCSGLTPVSVRNFPIPCILSWFH